MTSAADSFDIRPWLRLACEQRDTGAPIYDFVDANGAHGDFGSIAVHLTCSPFAVKKLGLLGFLPRACCHVLVTDAFDVGMARWLLKPGEIIRRELSRDEIADLVVTLEKASPRAPVYRLDDYAGGRTKAHILTLNRGREFAPRYLRACDVDRAWTVRNPGLDHVQTRVLPAAVHPRTREPLRTEADAVDRAEWLAQTFPICAGDIEALIRRAPMGRLEIAELARYARNRFEAAED